MTEKELAELDLAVAKAEGKNATLKGGRVWIEGRQQCGGIRFNTEAVWGQPTRDGAEAMRLLEKYRLAVEPGINNSGAHDWSACAEGQHWYAGETPAIAICRAVVALKGEP